MGQAVVPKKKKKPDDKHLVLRYFRMLLSCQGCHLDPFQLEALRLAWP